MKYNTFKTAKEAQEYCNQASGKMKIPEGAVTCRWAEPVEMIDGTFTVQQFEDGDNESARDWDQEWTRKCEDTRTLTEKAVDGTKSLWSSLVEKAGF